MKLKMNLLVILIAGLGGSCDSVDEPHHGLESSIKRVAGYFQAQSDELNRMIHPEIGVYVVHRPGVFDTFTKLDRIVFDSDEAGYFPYPRIQPEPMVTFDALPTYDCNDHKWSKTGFFCDPNSAGQLLSSTASNAKKYDLGKVDEATIDRFRDIERWSKRVVLVDENGNDLIFFLTLVDQEWFLTIVDRVTRDCDT